MTWLTIECERALYVDRGRTVVLCDRLLQFVNSVTGERAENPGKVDVTKRSEREIEKIERGMMLRAGPDWYVDDVIE